MIESELPVARNADEFRERVRTRLAMLRWGISIAALVSLVLALLVNSVLRGGWTVSPPGMTYFLMFLNYPLLRWGRRRWQRAEGLPAP